MENFLCSYTGFNDNECIFYIKKSRTKMMNSVFMFNIYLWQCWISLPSLPFPLFPDPGERWRTSSEEAGSRLFWVSTCDVSQTPVWRHYHGLWWFFFSCGLHSRLPNSCQSRNQWRRTILINRKTMLCMKKMLHIFVNLLTCFH